MDSIDIPEGVSSWAMEVDREFPLPSDQVTVTPEFQPAAETQSCRDRTRTPSPDQRPRQQDHLRRSPRMHKSSQGAACTATTSSRGRWSPDRRGRDPHRPPVPTSGTGGKRRPDNRQNSGSRDMKRLRDDNVKNKPQFREPAQPDRIKGDQTHKQCPISSCGQAATKHHAFDCHLPGLFMDQTLTEKVTTRRVSALKMCAKWVLGYPDLGPLLDFINALHQFSPRGLLISQPSVESARAICKLQQYPVPEVFSVAPVNSPAMLVHWRILLQVISCLEESQRTSLRDLFPVETSVIVEQAPEALDSHFHLDRTAVRAHRDILEVEKVYEAQRPDSEFVVRVTGGVAVFCDPPTYPTEEQVTQYRRQGLIVAIGMHPKTNVNEGDWQNFKRCLSFPGVTAFGEVGLDYSMPAQTWSQQHVVLDQALSLLRPDHVLILHGRPQMGFHDGSSAQMLYQLKGVVPRDQKIHLHCFSGDQAAVDLWVKEFPNTHFGYTALIKDLPRESKVALRDLDGKRLLIETDAPYFRFGSRTYSTPGMIGMTASIVGAIRGQDWTEVLELSNSNVRHLYGLPPSQ